MRIRDIRPPEVRLESQTLAVSVNTYHYGDMLVGTDRVEQPYDTPIAPVGEGPVSIPEHVVQGAINQREAERGNARVGFYSDRIASAISGVAGIGLLWSARGMEAAEQQLPTYTASAFLALSGVGFVLSFRHKNRQATKIKQLNTEIDTLRTLLPSEGN